MICEQQEESFIILITHMAQEQYPELESRLKNILQICVETVKPKLKSKAQLAELQDLLVDYQNNDELAEIIENVVKLAQKIYSRMLVGEQTKNMIQEQQYVKLEQAVQALQARQRAYIKSENQLKLYCEQLEIKTKQLEASKNQLVVSTKKIILDLKRDNQGLVQKIKSLASHKQHLNGDKLSELPKTRLGNNESADRLPKQLKNNQRAESGLRSKLEQYQEVIDSIEASRGKKYHNYGDNHKLHSEVK